MKKKIIGLNTFIYCICTALILLGIYLFLYHLLRGDLLFHTDIARDFLLIEEMAHTHQITLIGPRAGGIPGMFFGPVWIYLNLPIFLLGHGNPLVVGYFWIMLMVIALACTFFVTKKVFGLPVAFLSTALFTFTLIPLEFGFTQSFGQVIFSPLLVYAVYLFIIKRNVVFLGIAAFLSGVLFQFQPAFGMIFLFITFVLSLIVLIKRRQIQYMLIWLVAGIPFSTYILFELRHQFIETTAFFTFLFHHDIAKEQLTYIGLFQNRVEGFLNTLNITENGVVWWSIAFLAVSGYLIYISYKKRAAEQNKFILLVYIYYLGFWLMTLLFRGVVWDYYHWGFWPLLSIAFASLYKQSNKFLFVLAFGILLFFMVKNGIATTLSWSENFSGHDVSSWLIKEKAAQYVYNDAKGDFGYYIYSPSEFGYSTRYAMHYVAMTKQTLKGFLCEKRRETYLLYNPTPSGSKTDPTYWKEKRIAILGKPVWKKIIGPTTIEKYILTDKQQHIASDPNLICDLQFR